MRDREVGKTLVLSLNRCRLKVGGCHDPRKVSSMRFLCLELLPPGDDPCESLAKYLGYDRYFIYWRRHRCGKESLGILEPNRLTFHRWARPRTIGNFQILHGKVACSRDLNRPAASRTTGGT